MFTICCIPFTAAQDMLWICDRETYLKIKYVQVIAKRFFSKCPLYNINKSTQARLRYIVTRNGTKLERTSLSTGGSIVPAYDIVYIAQLDFGNKSFRNHLYICKQKGVM